MTVIMMPDDNTIEACGVDIKQLDTAITLYKLNHNKLPSIVKLDKDSFNLVVQWRFGGLVADVTKGRVTEFRFRNVLMKVK